jgi:hypothetical protein
MSKRFLLKRFLGLTEEEIVENEQMWREEADEPDLQTTQGQDLRSIGVTPAGMEADLQAGEEMANIGPGGELGGNPAGPGAPPIGGGIGVPAAPSTTTAPTGLG